MKKSAIMAVFCVALTGCGTMIPGSIYTADGKVMSFEIEKAFNTGRVAATDPVTNERFDGTYVGVRDTRTAVSTTFNDEGNARFSVNSASSNLANATAYMKGDRGTMLTCSMAIEAGLSPHGIGTCQDNKGGQYRLQF